MSRRFLLKWMMCWSLLTIPLALSAQIQHKSIENLEALQQKETRPVVIFFHTKWCSYCKAMLKTTFKNAKIQQSLNQSFYFVTFDAEQKKSFTFKRKDYHYKPSGISTGIHELAEEFATIKGKVSYPTLVVLNNKLEVLYQHDGFLKADELKSILNHFKLQN